MYKTARLLLLALPATASALSFDFTLLNGGAQGLLATSVSHNGVVASAFHTNLTTATNLWLRNVPNDHGLGVCSEGATACNTGGGDVNELDNNGLQEMILLERPDAFHWTSLWVSSLDSGGTGGSEEGLIRWGDDLNNLTGSFQFGFGNFGGSVEGDLFAIAAFVAAFDPDAKYILFSHPGNVGDNNDYLVWKGALDEGEFDAPEPGTLALLGIAAFGLALRRRRD